MQINHLIQDVTGPFDTTTVQLVCLKSQKHVSVELAIKSDDGWNIPIASIKLHSRDRYVDAKAVFQDACRLGDEIVTRWNSSLQLQQQLQEARDLASKYRNLSCETQEDADAQPLPWES